MIYVEGIFLEENINKFVINLSYCTCCVLLYQYLYVDSYNKEFHL